MEIASRHKNVKFLVCVAHVSKLSLSPACTSRTVGIRSSANKAGSLSDGRKKFKRNSHFLWEFPSPGDNFFPRAVSENGDFPVSTVLGWCGVLMT